MNGEPFPPVVAVPIRPVEVHPAPWDRQAGEPPVAYKRFIHYLQLGPSRTLDQLAAELPANALGRSPRPATLATQASYWNWDHRAALWDRHHELTASYEDLMAAQAAARRISAIMVSLRTARNIPPVKRDELLRRANRLLAELKARCRG